jgi:hypothetical protein
MIELANKSMSETLERWLSIVGEDTKPVEIDLINEVSLMFTRILLTCALGESLDGVELDWAVSGGTVKKDVPDALRVIFADCI